MSFCQNCGANINSGAIIGGDFIGGGMPDNSPSLRDRFAMAAMMGQLADGPSMSALMAEVENHVGDHPLTIVAATAYKAADAMIAARGTAAQRRKDEMTTQEELRDLAADDLCPPEVYPHLMDAADEIEQLRAALEEAREAHSLHIQPTHEQMVRWRALASLNRNNDEVKNDQG